MTSRIPTDMVADRTSKAKLSDTLGSIQTSINTNTSSLADRTKQISDLYINVMHPQFGLTACKGDGVTDDAPSIQAIFNYAITNNYNVYFPDGTYLLNSMVTFNNNHNHTVIEGQSKTNTIIRINSSTATCGVNFVNSELTVKNIRFRSNYQGVPAVAIGQQDVMLSACLQSLFENVVFYGIMEAITVYAMWDSQFINCEWMTYQGIANATEGAIFDVKPNANDSVNHLLFVRCHSEGTNSMANQFRAVGGAGGKHYNFKFQFCHFETRNYSTRNFYLENCDGIEFDHCQFSISYYGSTATDTQAKRGSIIKNTSRISFHQSGFLSMNYNNTKDAKIIQVIGTVYNLDLRLAYFYQNGATGLSNNIDITGVSLTTCMTTWSTEGIFGDDSIIPYKQRNIWSSPSNQQYKFASGFEPTSTDGTTYGSNIYASRFDSSGYQLQNFDETGWKWNGMDVNGTFISRGLTSTVRYTLIGASTGTYNASAGVTFAPAFINNPNRLGMYMIMTDVVGKNGVCMVYYSGTQLFPVIVPDTTLFNVTDTLDVTTQATASSIYITRVSSGGFQIYNNTGATRKFMILPFAFIC